MDPAFPRGALTDRMGECHIALAAKAREGLKSFNLWFGPSPLGPGECPVFGGNTVVGQTNAPPKTPWSGRFP